MQVWDLKDVGLQATQRISQAADPLRLLADISQNFPSLVSSLSRQKVGWGLVMPGTHLPPPLCWASKAWQNLARKKKNHWCSSVKFFG